MLYGIVGIEKNESDSATVLTTKRKTSDQIENDRIISVDAFRGFTIISMILANTMFVCKAIGKYSCYSVLLHKEWHGATFADLVFPFFLFIVGVSVILSYSKKIPYSGHKQHLLLRATWRAIKLFVLGVAVNVLMAGGEGPISVMGVLQRIGLVYLVCVLLYLFSNQRAQIAVCATILLSYWMAMVLIPVPSLGAGVLEPGRNLAAWIDQIIQPGALNMGTWDTEGLFSTIPAIGTGITGMLAGHLLISELTVERKVIGLFLGGFLSIALGQLWGLSFPFNKSLWTSSFVLYTSGWACVTLASFTWLLGIKIFRKWSHICIVLGRKSLFCYILHMVLLGASIFPLFDKQSLMSLSVLSLGRVLPLEVATLLFSFVIIAMCYGIVTIVYRIRICIKTNQ